MKNPLEMSWINILRRNVANDFFLSQGRVFEARP